MLNYILVNAQLAKIAYKTLILVSHAIGPMVVVGFFVKTDVTPIVTVVSKVYQEFLGPGASLYSVTISYLC